MQNTPTKTTDSKDVKAEVKTDANVENTIELKEQPSDKNSTRMTTGTAASTAPPEASGEWLKSLECPVFKQIFHTPVTLNCGGQHVIEEDAAKRLFHGKKTCPCCRNSFDRYELNRQLRELIEFYLKDHPNLKEGQYQPASVQANKKAEEKTATREMNPLDEPYYNPATEEVEQQQEILRTIQQTAHSNQQSSIRQSRARPIRTTPSPNTNNNNEPLIAIPQSNGQLRFFPTAYDNEGNENKREMETKAGESISLPTFAFITGLPSQQSGIKTLLLGASNSGKEQFITRLIPERNSTTTIGIDFTNYLSHYGQKFQLWNTAGQERFHSIPPSLYRGTNLILFFGEPLPWIQEIYQQFADQNGHKLFALSYPQNQVQTIEINNINATSTIIPTQVNSERMHNFPDQILDYFTDVIPKNTQLNNATMADMTEEPGISIAARPRGRSKQCCL